MSFSHFGLSLFVTPFIKQLPNIVHPWAFSFFIVTFIFWLPLYFKLDFLLIFNLPAPAADKSLAIPLTPKQSGLLGVIDKSITFSEVFLKYFSPILFAY